jgi:hypothetical protein
MGYDKSGSKLTIPISPLLLTLKESAMYSDKETSLNFLLNLTF